MRFIVLCALCACFALPSAKTQVIYLSTLNGQLYTLNITDCSYELVGTMPVSSTDISFHPNGNLYAVSSTGRLFEINLTNGTGTLIYTFEANASQLYTALTISATGVFYACGTGGDLWSFDLATGMGQYLGDTGFGAEGDLTFYNGQLYMAAVNDDIVRVDIDRPDNSSIAINGNVSGRIFGVVSYAASCDALSVYALTDNAATIYEVNFDSGTLDYFCNIPLQVSGGASQFEFLGSNPVTIGEVRTEDFDCAQPNGSIALSASGGVGRLQYSLNTPDNFSDTPLFTGLPWQPEYTVYVTDEVGCTVSETVSIPNNGPVFAEVNVTDIACGQQNGGIAVMAQGGTPPYLLRVNGAPQNGLMISGLSAGMYELTLEDAAGCSTPGQATISAAEAPVLTATVAPTSCGGNNGSILANVAGGSAPFQYRLDNAPAQGNPLFSALAAGQYVLAVLDNAGCEETTTVEVAASSALRIDSVQISALNCEGSLHNVALFFTGGVAPHTLSVANEPFLPYPATTVVAAPEGLALPLTLRDAVGCEVAVSTTIPSVLRPVLDLIAVDHADCLSDNGRIQLQASGGVGELQFTVNGQALPLAAVLQNLAPGSYLLELTDEEACADSARVDILQRACPVYVPNAFTPNADGVNDRFFPQSAGQADILVVRFRIFDRWGGMVHEETNTALPDLRGWDGGRLGQPLPQGIYTYYLEMAQPNGEKTLRSGDVLLVR